MKLTNNFWMSEFLHSSDHPQVAKEMVPSMLETESLFLLCTFGLQPLRDLFGRIQVTSGLRSIMLNKMLNGSKTSQHVDGEAADFLPIDSRADEVWDYILHKMGWEGQAFFYPKRGHIHLGLPRMGIKPTKKVIT